MAYKLHRQLHFECRKQCTILHAIMTQRVIRAFNHPLIRIQCLRKYQPLQFGKLYWNGTFPTEHYSSHTAHPHLCMWAVSLLHALHLFQSLFSVTSNVLGAENEGSWEAITSTVHGLLDMVRLINCCWVHAISPTTGQLKYRCCCVPIQFHRETDTVFCSEPQPWRQCQLHFGQLRQDCAAICIVSTIGMQAAFRLMVQIM